MIKKGALVLNLSKNFKFNYPSIKFTSFVFSGGEEHIKIEEDEFINKTERFIIASNMANSSDLMKIFLATDVLKTINNNAKIELFSPYFPYARQDRRMTYGEPFSIKVITNIINNQKYDKVHVFDPHSDITTALIDNINVIDNFNFVKLSWNDIKKK